MDFADGEGSALMDDLLQRCRNLLGELNLFKSFLEEARNQAPKSKHEHAVDTKHFQGMITTELKSLERLSAADLHAEKTIHMLKSSNLPFYTAIWEAAKSAKSLVTFSKRFYWEERPTRQSKRNMQKRAALVDIVAENGEEWIRVSTLTEERLLRELAKTRWEVEDSEEEDEENDSKGTRHADNGNTSLRDDEYDRIELVKVATDLQRASRANRIHYRYPQVRIILSNVVGPPSAELLPLFERIRSKGAIIDTSTVVSPSTTNALEKVIFPRLLPSPHPPLTDTVNIDCTILLALVSDLSYTAHHPIHPSFNAAIRRQIELETQDHLLPLSLWPALANKELVCTTEAVKRMREIVDTIGTPSERARTDLIIEHRGPDENTGLSSASNSERASSELRVALQNFSDYRVPESFTIPIRTRPAPPAIETTTLIQEGKLPPIAEQIAGDLSDINRSVFMLGWVHGFTTVSSNRAVVKAIERTIEKHAPGSKGPEVWLREPARSLVGKEKERRK